MRTAILTGAAVAPFIAAGLWWWGSPATAIGIMALSHAFVLYPTLRPNVQWLGPVITRFQTSGRELWLTIDDGPADDTPALLDLLDQRSARATFFVKGASAEARPELIREIVGRGHTVANHSQLHPSGTFWCLLPGRVKREIDECNRVIASITGQKPRLFRAPVGMKNPAVHPALASRNMNLIGWTARGFDATMKDADGVLARLLPRVSPGAIVVLHQGRPWSIDVIRRVIDELGQQGYTFVIPDEGSLQTKR